MNLSIKIIILYILFLSHTIHPQVLPIIPIDQHESLLAIVIMVKDEVDVIIPTLQPLIDVGVDSVLLYDTGSTDGTQDQVRTYFKDKNLNHAYIIEDPFIDFATSRNRALDTAEKLFPNITFFLMLDAEWYLHNAQELISFCKEHKNYIEPGTIGGCYSIRLITKQDNIDNYATRLIRSGKNVRYTGVVHETIQQPISGCLPKTVYFEYSPKEFGQKKSKNRYLRDYNLLQKSLENDPTNKRTLFYLGQTCQFLDKWEEAITYYKKRAEYNDISEECYVAYYRIGCAIERIVYGIKSNITTYTWNDALYYYLKAHAMLPHRAEPLVRIANYYLYIKDYAVAYLFASRAVELSYPYNDFLFVEQNIYNFLRYDILGQCALYVGEFEKGKDAILKAIKNDPSSNHLYHNLTVYLQHMAI